VIFSIFVTAYHHACFIAAYGVQFDSYTTAAVKNEEKGQCRAHKRNSLQMVFFNAIFGENCKRPAFPRKRGTSISILWISD
jgi:hypothetical protein